MATLSWEELADRSDEPAIQEFIRRAIHAGMIRVRAGATGKVRITPQSSMRNVSGPQFAIVPLLESATMPGLNRSVPSSRLAEKSQKPIFDRVSCVVISKIE